jgi:hypothetical protein
MVSPGEMLIVRIVTELFGKSSYQAEYCVCPKMESSSVPHWISVLSNWPPMPIHVAEKVSLADRETVETFHDAVMPVKKG